ncbi:hypothetical protein IFM89_000812 [Coptis chinensis]|uniref:Transposase-associated domain-containing protein n=1 Tax=Coptis chinensis TaxID=261450 RepID=A0A835IXE7_9MAGN|nr:hypothetical protein IFM89_000812 [Coptis chinensis]
MNNHFSGELEIARQGDRRSWNLETPGAMGLRRRMSQPIPKDWMNEIDKFGIVYKQGVSDFIQFASDKDPTSTTCPCPCNKCRNRKRFPFDIVRKHLILHGIESTYRVWVLHGLVGDLNGGDESEGGDLEPPYVLELDLGKSGEPTKLEEAI